MRTPALTRNITADTLVAQVYFNDLNLMKKNGVIVLVTPFTITIIITLVKGL